MVKRDKSPRHYAEAYIKAGDDKAKQKKALSGCPVDWRNYVRYLIWYLGIIDQWSKK